MGEEGKRDRGKKLVRVVNKWARQWEEWISAT